MTRPPCTPWFLVPLLLGACSAPAGLRRDPWQDPEPGTPQGVAPESQGSGAAQGTVPVLASPTGRQDTSPVAPPPVDDGADWVMLVSGEWLRGEIRELRRDVLDFDSDKLDDLEIDWEDVAQLRPAGPCAILLQNGDKLVDRVRVDGSVLRIGDPSQGMELTRSREDLVALVHSHKRERNYWRGNLDVGMTARKGNNDQVDAYFKAGAKRRTAASRLDLALTANESSVRGVETASNQRFTTNWSIYANRRFYWTPINLELYRDVFQNIAFRSTPGAGVGYLLIDDANTSWTLDAGAGVRHTRFLSVPPGEDDTATVLAALLGSNYEIELTRRTDLNLKYNAQVSLEDLSDTNQTLVAEFSVDITGDLDLGVTFQWDRVGQPVPDSDGLVPFKDDYRLILSVGWDF